jgi:hypothetical protein
MEEDVVNAVAELVDLNWQGLGRGTLRLLRERFPGIVFLAVAASDVTEEPFRQSGRVGFHFINTTDHCVSLVNDRRLAGGILLAVRE